MNILPTAIAVLVTTACAALAQDEGHHQKADKVPSPMVESLSKLKADAFGTRFLQTMIAHHETGTEMAKLVGERAESEELKKFAEKTVEKQKEDVEKMTNWLKEWYESDPDKSVIPEGSHKKMQEQLDLLKDIKGEKFDHTFITVMIDHHHGGITLFELVDGRTDRDSLETFATEGIEHQRAEIRELQAIVKE